jgi:hypothetical protein
MWGMQGFEGGKPQLHKSLTPRLCTVTPNVFSIIITDVSLQTKVSISSHALGNCLITVTFTGHSRIVGPQYRTCFMSILWHLELRFP